MSSETAKLAISNLISRIQSARETQTEMDSVYENLCSIIKTELHNTVPLLGATRLTNKRLRSRKPFWDDNLQRLWDIMRRNEEEFLKCKHDRWLLFQLRTEYVKSRNEFD